MINSVVCIDTSAVYDILKRVEQVRKRKPIRVHLASHQADTKDSTHTGNLLEAFE